MKKQEDGSYKVVGWEWHQKGEILHSAYGWTSGYQISPNRYKVSHYIPHDRKDQFAFISPASHTDIRHKKDVLVFENDIVYWVDTDGRAFTQTINWNGDGGCWNVGNRAYHHLKESGYYQTQMKITGIQGVTK
jgi:hypothetical protein